MLYSSYTSGIVQVKNALFSRCQEPEKQIAQYSEKLLPNLSATKILLSAPLLQNEIVADNSPL
jgi:hypothetical protein